MRDGRSWRKTASLLLYKEKQEQNWNSFSKAAPVFFLHILKLLSDCHNKFAAVENLYIL